MKEMKEIEVRAARPYRVRVGEGLLTRCGRELAALMYPCRVALVTDSNVGPLYAAAAQKSLEEAGFSVAVYTVPAGEASKSMAVLAGLLEFLARAEITRADCVAALGGGVVGDLAGFAAGCYLRGVRFVQLPTTLLAAVDSSVGGKTAVNLEAGKNLAGLFWQPEAVLCDIGCLATLSPELYACGAAEIIKTAVLDGEELFARLEAGGLAADTGDVIARCVAFKARVVEADEREQGLRKTLNLGHTLGHGVERCSGYQIPHGQAVAIGLAHMARAAAALGKCDAPTARRIIRLLEAHHLPTHTDFGTRELAEAALHDKKRAGDTITLIIPRAIGRCDLWDVAVEDLPGIIDAGREERL